MSQHDDLVKVLTDDNCSMRRAGLQLAEAAIHVIREHDGLHRLSIAVSEWAIVIANEGGRSHGSNPLLAAVFAKPEPHDPICVGPGPDNYGEDVGVVILDDAEPEPPKVDIGPMPFTVKELNAVWCNTEISYADRQTALAEFVWNAAVAEVLRQIGGTLCTDSPSSPSPSSCSCSASSTVEPASQPKGSGLTDEEIYRAFVSPARWSYPTIQVAPCRLRAVADLAARSAAVKMTADDIKWLCSATMPEAIAYRLHDRGVVVAD